MNQELAKIEALLFQYGEPLTIGRIARILRIKERQCEELLSEYEESLKKEGRGLMLLRNSATLQLVTKPEFKAISQEIAKEEFREELTPAALEVLTIVAYLGPVPRRTIEYVRGVNSSFTLRNLFLRGLIEREKKGIAYYYSPTFDFLKHMGLESKEKLPEYEKYRNVLQEHEINEQA